ncbi:MAG: Maf family protein [Terriglobia bacterium]
MTLILASASPRRRELLRNAGVEFESLPAHIDESRLDGETAEEYVRRLAREKASVVAQICLPGRLVLAADTTVELNGEILGKPQDVEDARRMLRLLSGATHRVLTGVCIICAPAHLHALEVVTTAVTFCRLDEDEIQAYVSTGEPFDKAGGYGIQGLASKFVTRVEGCFFNVVGLPVARVYALLKSLSDRAS